MGRPWRALSIMLLFLFGISVVVAGWRLGEDQVAKTLLISLGGAVLGAAISSFVGFLEIFDLIAAHHQAVASVPSERLRSGVVEASRFKKDVWHHYYVTIINGAPTWQYGTIDFRSSLAPGRLITRTHYIDKYGSPKEYECEAVVLDGRLVLTVTLLGDDESPDVCVFPFMMKSGVQNRCGLGFRETWDGPNSCGPDILSETRLIGQVKGGTILAHSDTAKLNTIWRDGVSATMHCYVVERNALVEAVLSV